MARMMRPAQTLTDLRTPGTDPSVDPADGWGVAVVERRNSMVSGGVTVHELHWYPNVAQRRDGADRYHRWGAVFVTADGIYVRDSTLNMGTVPLPRWEQMAAAWSGMRRAARAGTAVTWPDWVTHRWVRRPENGGARLMRDHLDLIKPPEPADINSPELVTARLDIIADAEGRKTP